MIAPTFDCGVVRYIYTMATGFECMLIVAHDTPTQEDVGTRCIRGRLEICHLCLGGGRSDGSFLLTTLLDAYGLDSKRWTPVSYGSSPSTLSDLSNLS